MLHLEDELSIINLLRKVDSTMVDKFYEDVNHGSQHQDEDSSTGPIRSNTGSKVFCEFLKILWTKVPGTKVSLSFPEPTLFRGGGSSLVRIIGLGPQRKYGSVQVRELSHLLMLHMLIFYLSDSCNGLILDKNE